MEDDVLTLDRNTGDFYWGEVTVTEERPEELLTVVTEWGSTESA